MIVTLQEQGGQHLRAASGEERKTTIIDIIAIRLGVRTGVVIRALRRLPDPIVRSGSEVGEAKARTRIAVIP